MAGQTTFAKTNTIDEDLKKAEELAFELSLPAHAKADAPLIVILGWYGSQDRFLAKYSQFLETEGYPTIRAIAPPSSIFWPHPRPRRAFALELLRFIRIVQGPSTQRPVIFYVFSNGGAFIINEVEYLTKMNEFGATVIPNGNSIGKIHGIIFDSAPCYMHTGVAVRALGEGKPWPMKILLAIAFYMSILVGLFLHSRWPKRYWQAMTDLQLGNASLYLYSANDPLCDVDALEGLIAARKASGHVVMSKRWERSTHVAHFRNFPEEYKGLVLGFIRDVLNTSRKREIET